jgi:pimeloyl-ACP methyl ester carboxylesterase
MDEPRTVYCEAQGGCMTAFNIVLIVVCAVVLWILSTRLFYAPPLRDKNGKRLPASASSIASLERVKINGSWQWIALRGQDRNAPVLLFLHGGPGSPETPMTRKYFSGNLEASFVVVSWDQRGAGKSFSARGTEKLTLDLMIADTLALVDLLCGRFHKDKIYLAGHSWGSLLGTLFTERYPELVAAYCGIGQLASGIDNEKTSYRWALAQAKMRGDHKGIQALEAIAAYGENPAEPAWMKDLMVERKWLGVYGGAGVHAPSFMQKLVKVILFAPEYSLRDKINFLRGSLVSLKDLWLTVLKQDVRVSVPRLPVPVMIAAGRFDYNTPCTLALAYYEQLEAPRKEFIWFEESAHSPCFEESERFARELTRFFLG